VKKRTLVAAVLAVVFVLALATPVFAMTHSATYEWDGTVTMERQVGHFCNTGAEQKVAIYGDGKMERSSDATMSKGIVTVEETNDFVTAEDATNNLTVTSVIRLCAPPKTEYTTTRYVYGEEVGWQSYNPVSGAVLDVRDWYDGVIKEEDLIDLAYDAHGDDPELLAQVLDGGRDFVKDTKAADADHDADFTETTFSSVSDQIWAVQVEAKPGMSGNLHKDFEAAHGDTYWGSDEEFTGASDQWGFVDAANHDGYTAVRGTDYVGSYFNIDQHARTSDGILKRFIDISSPWSHAYLMEDFEVEGEVDVEEAFTMTNIAAGEDIEVLWYDLF